MSSVCHYPCSICVIAGKHDMHGHLCLASWPTVHYNGTVRSYVNYRSTIPPKHYETEFNHNECIPESEFLTSLDLVYSLNPCFKHHTGLSPTYMSNSKRLYTKLTFAPHRSEMMVIATHLPICTSIPLYSLV